MTLKDKLMSKLSDIRDDIDFLRRDDVSTLFKVLNIISGDRLRNYVAFAAFGVYQVQMYFEHLEDLKSAYGELSADDYEAWADVLLWYVNRASKHLDDIWKV